MALDVFKNFAKVQVSTGYDDSATSVVLSGGHGTKLPAVPFNATWWNSTDFADPSDDPNVEIVRVTAVATDTLTVTRAQESTSASTKNTASKTYRMIAGLTAKTLNIDLMTSLMCQGRLTLEAGVPVSSTDQTAKTSIKFTPHEGNRISLIDGSVWKSYAFTELDLPLGTLANTFPHDVFAVAGTPVTLEKVGWASAAARASAISLQDGRWVKTSDPTRLLLGTFLPTSTTEIADTVSHRGLSNIYNKQPRRGFKIDATVHTYGGAAWRFYNGDATNYVRMVAAVVQDVVIGVAGTLITSGAPDMFVGVGFDTIAVPSGEVVIGSTLNGQVRMGVALSYSAPMGSHDLNLIQYASSGAPQFQNSSVSLIFQN